jgi:hypothetical protein
MSSIGAEDEQSTSTSDLIIKPHQDNSGLQPLTFDDGSRNLDMFAGTILGLLG